MKFSRRAHEGSDINTGHTEIAHQPAAVTGLWGRPSRPSLGLSSKDSQGASGNMLGGVTCGRLCPVFNPGALPLLGVVNFDSGPGCSED